MPLTLLPASAAAFAPRSAPTIVLNSRVEQWLTQTLKRINKVKRPLNSVTQHYRCLTDTLSGDQAIWTLASIMLPKAPESELRKDENLLVEALWNYQLIHIEAYIVHVDMVSQHEVAFKLTQDTIDTLIEYHKDIYSVDAAASTWNWTDKELQLKKLQEDFVQTINRYVYRTNARALEGLEEEGAGELLEGRSAEVKDAIMGLFLPLLPPPPPVVDLVVTAPLISTYPAFGSWWQPAPSNIQQQQHHHQQQQQHQQYMTQSTHLAPPAEGWRVLGSSPSPTSGATESMSSPWSPAPAMNETHLPSPAPSYNQPYTSAAYYSSAQAVAPVMSLPLPSVVAQQCGPAASSAMSGFAWQYGNDFAPQYTIQT